MLFNKHSNLVGLHAAFSASQYHWVNYDEDKLERVFLNKMDAARGTRLHALACELISMKVKMGKSPKTLNMYVNDAIGFRMNPEQVLFYSENFFGTADAVSFRDNLLRIHDLKNGVHPGSMHQLEVYAALFCLEYGFRPGEIEIELRIYQNDEINIVRPEPDVIAHVMDRIVTFDQKIKRIREEADR